MVKSVNPGALASNGLTGVGYVRVSGESQVQDGVSLDAQRQKIEAYCDLHDIRLIGIYADEGISGKQTENRPGLQRALSVTIKNKAALITYSLSRLSRTTRDAIEIAERLSKANSNLVSLSEQLNTTSASGTFFFHVIAALSEMERNQVSERTRLALSYKRAQGKRISRWLPYGFALSDDKETLVPVEQEQAVIQRICAWRSTGQSYRKIACRLNTAGVASKRGGVWHAGVVQAICSRVSTS